jgi:Fur family zinc uptake transcriptional regulator
MCGKSRNTRQKEILANLVKNFNSFFNAEDLFELAVKKDKSIGIATVYRFLKELRGRGKVHSYSCDRKTIYSIDKRSHCHFFCEKCGEVDHIDIKSLDFFEKKFKGKICHFQIDVSGVCEKCG